MTEKVTPKFGEIFYNFELIVNFETDDVTAMAGTGYSYFSFCN